jgi:hypothetical protein
MVRLLREGIVMVSTTLVSFGNNFLHVHDAGFRKEHTVGMKVCRLSNALSTFLGKTCIQTHQNIATDKSKPYIINGTNPTEPVPRRWIPSTKT